MLSRLAARSQQQRRHFSGRLQGMRRPGRRQLTDSLALSMDELLKANRNDPHLKMMGASIRLVIGEYKDARERDDRRQALEQIIKLIELLDQRASRTSWLERHQKLLAVATGTLALLGTGASQLSGYVLSPVRLDGCPDRPLAGGESYQFSSLLRGDPGLADKVLVVGRRGREKARRHLHLAAPAATRSRFLRDQADSPRRGKRQLRGPGCPVDVIRDQGSSLQFRRCPSMARARVRAGLSIPGRALAY